MEPEVTARQKDANGFLMIQKNPISRAGVFPYRGTSIPGADPNKIYNVYRPEEELTSPETLESFKLLPFYDEHEMVGEGFDTAPEDKLPQGATGENFSFENGTLFGNLRVFSERLKALIESGKKGLSMGYRCAYEKSAGFFEGMPYDYIQRQIRGNHLALVHEGRCGTAVKDHHWAYDHFDIALDQRESVMAEPEKKSEAEDTEKKELSLAEVTELLGKIMPQIEKLNEALAPKKEAVNETNALDNDTKEKPGDAKAEDEEAEKKKDEDETKKEEGKAMDHSEKFAAFETRLGAVEKRGTKDVLSDVTARDRLVKEVTPVIGTFDSAEMTADEVAAYACDKLDLKPEKGHERAALRGYLAGHAAAKQKDGLEGFALDHAPKEGGLLAKRLNGATA